MKKRGLRRFLPALAGGVFLVLCIFGLQRTISVTEVDFANGATNFSPLYAWFLGAWGEILGGEEFVLRALSSLFGAFAILLISLLFKYKVGAWQGLLTAFLSAVLPVLLYFGQKIHPFMLYFFVILLNLCIFEMKFYSFPRQKYHFWAILYVLSVLIGFLTHFSFGLIVLIEMLMFLKKGFSDGFWRGISKFFVFIDRHGVGRGIVFTIFLISIGFLGLDILLYSGKANFRQLGQEIAELNVGDYEIFSDSETAKILNFYGDIKVQEMPEDSGKQENFFYIGDEEFEGFYASANYSTLTDRGKVSVKLFIKE